MTTAKQNPRAVQRRTAKAINDKIARRGTAAKKRLRSAEAEELLRAISADQVDALVIRRETTEELYALKSFDELEQTQAALASAGAEQSRTHAQLAAFAEERERLFQDMHDGCIHSIYAVGLNLEACLRILDSNPGEARQMIADANASLNLVIQELRSFITGQQLQVRPGGDLLREIRKAASAARNAGLVFAFEIEEVALKALTPAQELHLLQIAREAISNSTRHANAQSGVISLTKRRGKVCLEVSDTGTGIVAEKRNVLGMGLHHIDARARKMGGTARVISAPKRGTRIVVDLPKAR